MFNPLGHKGIPLDNQIRKAGVRVRGRREDFDHLHRYANLYEMVE